MAMSLAEELLIYDLAFQRNRKFLLCSKSRSTNCTEYDTLWCGWFLQPNSVQKTIEKVDFSTFCAVT